MKFDRGSGILLHPTSLPGPFGVGDLGPTAHEWLEFLANSGCKLWQILPLGPTGFGDSPYQCFSAFAGNSYLISPEALVADGLLDTSILDEAPDFSKAHVDFGRVIPWKLSLLDRAFIQFEKQSAPAFRGDYIGFLEKHKDWLDDFALFMALKDAYGGAPWTGWDPHVRQRDPDALAHARRELEAAIRRQVFHQFIFFRQWESLHAHAGRLGLQIIGDIPIFIAHDSADVWSHPDLFYLDKNGNPTVVAGVPPDYFSPTGQRWGNPLYRWRVHKADGYSWWQKRLCATLEMVDIMRIDHFRGFSACWEVPGKAKTAENGRWVRAPGRHFFQSLQDNLGSLPIIAEDLGVITPEVEELRDRYHMPGMKIVQFSFAGGPDDPFLPHNYPRDCVVYTGTHDNDTSRGWYERVPEGERDFYRRYLDRNGENVAWDLIRAAWASVAVLALAPMQDFLNLGNEARMNYPGNPSGNWTWRMPESAMDAELEQRIKELNYLYGRLSGDTDRES